MCTVLEAYDDSQAVITHSANVGDLAQQAAEIGGGLQVVAYGEMSAELAQMLEPVGATKLAFFAGS